MKKMCNQSNAPIIQIINFLLNRYRNRCRSSDHLFPNPNHCQPSGSKIPNFFKFLLHV
jgi:hypothetical protein